MNTKLMVGLVILLSLLLFTSASAQGGCSAGRGYDPECDVNYDGQTNTLDLQLVANRWGESGATAAGQGGFYTGTSRKGNFQEALDNAIAAVPPQPCCDQMLHYRVVKTEGRVGGIAGVNELDVTIWVSGDLASQ